jgi:hypothetical protein
MPIISIDRKHPIQDDAKKRILNNHMLDQNDILSKTHSFVWCFIICFVIAILFVTGAPMDGAFSWSDSPRHALNGAFIMDMLKDMPTSDPIGYAHKYYSQFPALTILFYPPLYSFILAPFYAVFGVSQETALLAGFICYCFFAVGTYYLARFWLSSFASFGATLILCVAPEIAFWGRQVMLEIPVYAFMVWSAYHLNRYVRTDQIKYLYFSVALLVLATYTKSPVVFIALPYLIVLFQHRGIEIFKDKHNYVILALAILGMTPLIYITFEFGQSNIQAAIDSPEATNDTFTLEVLFWYLIRIPSQLGYAAIAGIFVAFATFILWTEDKIYAIRNSLFLILWFVVGYFFYTFIELKLVRFSIHMLLPLALYIGFACDKINEKKQYLGSGFIAIIMALTLAETMTTRPVEYVAGYNDVVEKVTKLVPQNSNILFSGYRDGSFIFAMRAIGNRPDVSIVRSDKLLLRIASRRELGIEEKNYTIEEIAELINKYAIHYVVAQPDFWIDLEQMKLLQSLLESDRFKEIQRFKMEANYDADEKELVIYRNLGNVADGPVNIKNELLLIGRSISNNNSND